MATSSNVLVDKVKRSEKDVIKDWLVNIFKTWERTNDLEIKEFKLTQMKHDSNVINNIENGGLGHVRAGLSSKGLKISHFFSGTSVPRVRHRPCRPARTVHPQGGRTGGFPVRDAGRNRR